MARGAVDMSGESTTEGLVERMAAAAAGLRESLSAEQRTKALFRFNDHAQRRDWHYIPRQQAGLPLADLSAEQRMLAHRLIRTGLSFQAYARANTIVALENVLGALEEQTGQGMPGRRDPGLYFVSIFGEPGATGSWGWRFQGHHVSINYTIVDGEVAAATPLFLGANPARVRHEGYDVLRPLSDAEDRARELLASLKAEQKARAIVGPEAPIDIVLGNLPHPSTPHEGGAVPGVTMPMPPNGPDVLRHLKFDPDRPAGIAGGDLTAGQRELLGRLVAVYADRFPEGVAWREMRAVDDLHFAWAGSEEVGRGHYYRLHGPALVVEYDNVQNDANHVHTVCRHPRNDFAAELLGLHYADAHVPTT